MLLKSGYNIKYNLNLYFISFYPLLILITLRSIIFYFYSVCNVRELTFISLIINNKNQRLNIIADIQSIDKTSTIKKTDAKRGVVSIRRSVNNMLLICLRFICIC